MEYKIITQKNVSVLSFSGDITRHDRESLEKLYEEVSGIQCEKAVLVFKNTNLVETITFRDLTMIQHEFRKKNAAVKIVGLPLMLKNTLSEGGVIRLAEVRNSLEDALAS